MAALHDALKSLGPTEFSQVPVDDPTDYVSQAFSAGQLIIDSIPIPPPSVDATSESRFRSDTTSSVASAASEISISSARSAPPHPDIEALQKEWKPVKMNPKENPLGMNVYKLGGKDGKGAWFARRSVHEGLGFTKWKKGLEKEFPETMKVKGAPGEGNIRGIGGERRVEYINVDGVGKLGVYLLTAQFPGPTTPRDFVTMLMTSDQVLSDPSGGNKVPRHFMVISKPCIHPETPLREGFIRGQYESVEFIREIPIKQGMKKSASTTNLTNQSRNRSGSTLGKEAMLPNAKQTFSPPSDENGVKEEETKRARGKTISFDKSRGAEAKGEDVDIPKEDDECESNPVEWIMVTRSDPGGSVPRFMIERGTPGGIVNDASKFLNWACAKELEDFESDDEAEVVGKHQHRHHHEKDLHGYQTNGHLAGIEESQMPESTQPQERDESSKLPEEQHTSNGGIYGIIAGVAGSATGYIASHAPAMISNHLPSQADSQRQPISRHSSTSSASSAGSYTSALEESETRNADADSMQTTTSSSQSKALTAAQDKELQKLEEKKRKLAEKLSRAREKEQSKKTEDSAKEEEALRKVEEKHEKEVKKQEEKYKKEVERLEQKKAREEMKAEERRKKAQEKDERTRLLRELDEAKADLNVLRKEKEILTAQVGDLQRENTALAARVGRLGVQGEEVLREVRSEGARGSRVRARSLMGLANGSRSSNVGSTSASQEREKQKENIKEAA